MMSDETVLIYPSEMKRGVTYPLSVTSLARIRIAIVVELEDAFEDDYPADPHACSVEDGFDGVLNSVEEFNRTLNPFANVTPADRD